MTCGSELVQVKADGLEGKLCDPTGHTTASMTKSFFTGLVVLTFGISFKFGFYFGGRLQRPRVDARRQGGE